MKKFLVGLFISNFILFACNSMQINLEQLKGALSELKGKLVLLQDKLELLNGKFDLKSKGTIYNEQDILRNQYGKELIKGKKLLIIESDTKEKLGMLDVEGAVDLEEVKIIDNAPQLNRISFNNCSKLKFISIHQQKALNDLLEFRVLENLENLELKDIADPQLTMRGLSGLKQIKLENLQLKSLILYEFEAEPSVTISGVSVEKMEVEFSKYSKTHVINKAVKEILENVNDLKELHVNYCTNLDSISWDRFKNIKTLVFNECDLSDAMLELILEKCVNLTSLSICNCSSLTPSVLAKVLNHFAQKKGLRDLSLSGVKLNEIHIKSNAGLHLTLNNCDGLKNMDVKFKIPAGIQNKIFLLKCKDLEVIILEKVGDLKIDECGALRTIDFSKIGRFNSDGAIVDKIFDFKKFQNLQSLKLDDISIGNLICSGLTNLISLELSNLNGIKELDLSGTAMSNDELQGILQKVHLSHSNPHLYLRHTKLETLNIQWNGNGAIDLSDCENLTTADLQGVSLVWLKGCNNLAELTLSKVKIFNGEDDKFDFTYLKKLKSLKLTLDDQVGIIKLINLAGISLLENFEMSGKFSWQLQLNLNGTEFANKQTASTKADKIKEWNNCLVFW